jgi:hypothetical protein
MQEQVDSGELELAKCWNWIIEPDPLSMIEALPNLRNRDAAAVVGPRSGVPRAERAASAAGRVRYHYQAISASSHLCWARCGVNFWLRGPRLTASCHWNVPECGTSGSSVEYANVLGGGWFGSFLVVWCFFFLPLLWTSFSCPKIFLIGSRISRSFMRLMSLSVCLSMYHPRTFFCKIMSEFGKSSDLSRVSARC